MNRIDFVRTAKAGVYIEISSTAHCLNDALMQAGLYFNRRFVQLENGV